MAATAVAVVGTVATGSLASETLGTVSLFSTGLAEVITSLIELRLSKRLVSSSNTLLRAKSCLTIGEGCVGFKSNVNLDIMPKVEVELPLEPAVELRTLDGVSVLAEVMFKVGSALGVAVGVCAGVLPALEPDHFWYFSSKALSLSSNVMVAGSCATASGGCTGGCFSL